MFRNKVLYQVLCFAMVGFCTVDSKGSTQGALGCPIDATQMIQGFKEFILSRLGNNISNLNDDDIEKLERSFSTAINDIRNSSDKYSEEDVSDDQVITSDDLYGTLDYALTCINTFSQNHDKGEFENAVRTIRTYIVNGGKTDDSHFKFVAGRLLLCSSKLDRIGQITTHNLEKLLSELNIGPLENFDEHKYGMNLLQEAVDSGHLDASEYLDYYNNMRGHG